MGFWYDISFVSGKLSLLEFKNSQNSWPFLTFGELSVEEVSTACLLVGTGTGPQQLADLLSSLYLINPLRNIHGESQQKLFCFLLKHMRVPLGFSVSEQVANKIARTNAKCFMSFRTPEKILAHLTLVFPTQIHPNVTLPPPPQYLPTSKHCFQKPGIMTKRMLMSHS